MTTLYRYLKWDGSQPGFDLGAEDFFSELSDYLMEGWTPDEACEWILKQGLKGQSVKVMGIDDLRSELNAWRQNSYDRFNPAKALDEIKDELGEIVSRELAHLNESLPSGSDELRERQKFLGGLDPRPGQAIESLRDYDFLDDEAADRFRALLERLEDIRKVERFIKRFGEKFTGGSHISFDDLLELIDRLEESERIERSLISGNFDDLDAGRMDWLLSGEGQRSLLLLKNFKSALEKSGFVRTRGERTELTPKGIRKLGEGALTDVFSSLKRNKIAEHETGLRGSGSARPEESKDYEFGDPFNLNIVQTLKKSLARESGGKGIKVDPEDFEVFETEYQTHAATALLLDLSWSMSFQGRFPAAKRVALALDHLIRTKYPKDDLHIIGFSTSARKLKTKELAVTTWDSNDPFTNIQEALSVAARTLSASRNTNKQIILITDGQPTAYYLDGYLQVELPMFFGGLSPRATFETLKEVKRVTGMGIRINTFMLDDSPSLRRFVDEMTRINKGRAFFTTPEHLGKYLFVDYLKRKRKVL
ncbi:MAG: VWA domain-containing protein [Thermodesulfobacteriota bacterium]